MDAHDARKLERYERFARDVRVELEQVEAELKERRDDGKAKTAYQQLLARHAVLTDIMRRLGEAGL